MEEFKEIPGYNGKYSISKLGKIRDNNTGEIEITSYNAGGYEVANLDGKRPYVHQLVLGTYFPNQTLGMQVDHKNNIKKDNRLENLQWLTKAENLKKAYRDGRYLKGSQQPMAKLTEKIVIEFRKAYAMGAVTMTAIAKQLCVSVQTISAAIHRRTWKHI